VSSLAKGRSLSSLYTGRAWSGLVSGVIQDDRGSVESTSVREMRIYEVSLGLGAPQTAGHEGAHGRPGALGPLLD